MLGDLPYDVHICLDREENATGIEGAMVSLLNEVDNPFWLSALDLPRRTREALRAALPVQRFRDLRKAEGMGKTTYERVHGYLYGCVKPST
ncbi:MAG TPA: hypothetical protein VGM23_18080 [Armatimonadota bacterium]|jgi:hypothetical protein